MSQACALCSPFSDPILSAVAMFRQVQALFKFVTRPQDPGTRPALLEEDTELEA